MVASPDREDLALLAAWRDGDGEAGNELGRRYFFGVYRFFAAKVPDAAEELVQRTFLACAEGRERIGAAGFRAYLFGVARKQLLRHFEGRGELHGIEQLSQRSIADLRTSPSQVLADQQAHAQLVAAMQTLPIDFQIVLELFYWQSLSLVEIAESLEIAVGTVKSRLSRAKSLLRDALARAGGPVTLASLQRSG